MDDTTSTLVPSQSTPIKHGTSTLLKFTTNHRYQLKEMTDMDNEMEDYIVGLMPAADFLDEFLPMSNIETTSKARKYKPGCFESVISCEKEPQAYKPFVSDIYIDGPLTINDMAIAIQVRAIKRFAPSLDFINSSAHVDRSGQSAFSFDIKPDICAYATGCKPLGSTDVARVEVIIEFKWHETDNPFCKPYPLPEDPNRSFFLCDSKSGHDTLGQITLYAAAQLGSQFCTHIYSVLIVKDYARLIRWDRSGAIVTEAIPYNMNPALAEFFRRYHKAPPNVRGVDTTVMVPTDEEIALARDCLDLDKKLRLVKMTVPAGDSEWSYVATTPIAQPYTPPGRATRGFVAYNLQRRRKVFVKDTWRVDLPDIEREGETYELMARAQVRNIASCSAAGDIGNHQTLTHLYANKPWACHRKRDLVPHRHYRLVLDVIGDDLTTFSSSREMLRYMVHALEGKES
jgi:Fungal protein kinase